MKQKKLNNREISMLCLEISLFLHAGMDIGSSLTLIADEDKELRGELLDMAETVFSGVSLSDAAEQSGLFPRELIAMLKIGEKTGRLEEALNSLSGYYTYRDNAARRIRSAVFYPSVLLLVMLAVTAMLLWKVVPIFDEVYASFGGEIPLPGRMLSAVLPVLLGIVGLVCAVSVGILCSAKCRAWIGQRLEKTEIAQKIHTAHFARALYMAAASGLDAEESVETAGMMLGSTPDTAAGCRVCLEKLQSGNSLAEAALESGLLPPTECRLLGLAMMSGAAERACLEIARRLEEDADDALERVISRIEPVMILTSSVLIGGILLGVMLPMANLLNLIG